MKIPKFADLILFEDDDIIVVNKPAFISTLDEREGSEINMLRLAKNYADDAQKEAFEAAEERAKEHWDKPLTTELKPLDVFYPAEDYHQDYFNKNPGNGYCSIVIAPKIVKARSAYTKWFKES